jgi:hypothetical protein
MSRWNDRWATALRVWLLVILTLGAGFAQAQTEQAPPREPFKPEEIEALVAPIALYPDSVLSQVLMASTYRGTLGQGKSETQRRRRREGCRKPAMGCQREIASSLSANSRADER